MLKTLLKVQILELFSLLTAKKSKKKNSKNKSTNKNNSSMVSLFITIGILLVVAIGFGAMCIPMAIYVLNTGYDWVYFGVFAVTSVICAAFFNMFVASNTLFQTKDNNLLLSLPIKTSLIIVSRMFLLYITCFVFNLVIWFSSLIVALNFGSFDPPSLFVCFSYIFVLPLLSTVLSCVIGWLIGILSRNKNLKTVIYVLFFTVIISISFFARFIIQDSMANLINNLDTVSSSIKANCFPIYLFGYAASGNMSYFFIIILVIFAIFAVTCFLISKFFISIVTSSKGAKQKVYKSKLEKRKSIASTIFIKEKNLLLKTPVYLVNTCFGIVMVIIGIVFLFVQYDSIQEFLISIDNIEQVKNIISCIILLIGGIILGFNCIAVPSLSLEGRSIWILKSLPIDIKEVLKGITTLQFAFNLPVFLGAIICSGIVFKFNILLVALMAIFAVFLIFTSAKFCTIIGLKRCNLVWTNPTVPVKQSLAVLFGMLFAIFLSIILCVLCAFSSFFINIYISFLICILIMLGIILILNK